MVIMMKKRAGHNLSQAIRAQVCRRGGTRVKLLTVIAVLLLLAFAGGGGLWLAWHMPEPAAVARLADPGVTPGVTTMTTTVPQATAVARVPRVVPVTRARRATVVSGVAAVTNAHAVAVPENPVITHAEHELFAALRASVRTPIPAEVVALAQKITADCTNDLQRAQALYHWLADNIRYDVDEWAHVVGGGDGYSHDHDPLSVLQRGTTVCIGYSWLFNALAQSVDLKSTFLIGDVRGYRGTPDDTIISAFKHAWNAVQVDGKWLLLDATWGARQADEGNESYAARSAYYFDTPANQLIFDHLPESVDWQLLREPVPDVTAFRSLPNLKPAFFRDGLRLVNATGGAVRLDTGTRGNVSLQVPDGIGLVATLSDAVGGQTVQLPVAAAEGQHDISVGPLASGSYVLRVYSAPQAADARFECAVDYAVTVP